MVINNSRNYTGGEGINNSHNYQMLIASYMLVGVILVFVMEEYLMYSDTVYQVLTGYLILTTFLVWWNVSKEIYRLVALPGGSFFGLAAVKYIFTEEDKIISCRSFVISRKWSVEELSAIMERFLVKNNMQISSETKASILRGTNSKQVLIEKLIDLRDNTHGMFDWLNFISMDQLHKIGTIAYMGYTIYRFFISRDLSDNVLMARNISQSNSERLDETRAELHEFTVRMCDKVESHGKIIESHEDLLGKIRNVLLHCLDVDVQENPDFRKLFKVVQEVAKLATVTSNINDKVRSMDENNVE